jgi:hypothetical protein
VGELLKENTDRHGQSLAQALPGFNLGRASCSSLLHFKWSIGFVKGRGGARCAPCLLRHMATISLSRRGHALLSGSQFVTDYCAASWNRLL